MSESSRTPADGLADETLNLEELFANDDTDSSIEDGESGDSTVAANTQSTATVADTTAGELFAELRDDHDDAASEDVNAVTEASPAAIMARADEETQHVDQIDEAIRADESALDDLLLTGRREADGFLRVETADDADADALPSLFQPSDAERETGTSADEAPENTSEDDFSLDPADGPSFEARAATFDDADDGSQADADAFQGGVTETNTSESPDSTDGDGSDDESETDRRGTSNDATESSHPVAPTDSDGTTDVRNPVTEPVQTAVWRPESAPSSPTDASISGAGLIPCRAMTPVS